MVGGEDDPLLAAGVAALWRQGGARQHSGGEPPGYAAHPLVPGQPAQLCRKPVAPPGRHAGHHLPHRRRPEPDLELARAGRSGGPAGPVAARPGHRPWRCGSGLSAQYSRNRSRHAGDHQPGGDLDLHQPGFWRGQRSGALRPDPPQSAVCGGWLSL